jgi:heme oxygenase
MPKNSDAGQSNALLARLRQATTSLHERLDSRLDLQPATVTREKYAAFLHAMLAVVPELEQRITRVPHWTEAMPEAERRLRSGFITRDLQALGLGIDTEPHARTPLPPLPAIETLGQAFGASYVLEGSALGGAVLARTIGPALGLTPESGVTYWSAYGSDLRGMWTEFVAALERWAGDASEPERESVIETAIATFEAFLQVCGKAAPAASLHSA